MAVPSSHSCAVGEKHSPPLSCVFFHWVLDFFTFAIVLTCSKAAASLCIFFPNWLWLQESSDEAICLVPLEIVSTFCLNNSLNQLWAEIVLWKCDGQSYSTGPGKSHQVQHQSTHWDLCGTATTGLNLHIDKCCMTSLSKASRCSYSLQVQTSSHAKVAWIRQLTFPHLNCGSFPSTDQSTLSPCSSAQGCSQVPLFHRNWVFQGLLALKTLVLPKEDMPVKKAEGLYARELSDLDATSPKHIAGGTQWDNKHWPEQPRSQKATRALSLGLDHWEKAREAYRHSWFRQKKCIFRLYLLTSVNIV